MRTYGQHCALAKALDVIGDRWTLLIVRELSIRPCRYTDLREGLPGIATNLLAERLRSMEAAGIVVAELAPPPVATTLYRLGPRGEELLPVVGAIGRWGAPFMADHRPGDEFRPRWVVPAVRAMFGIADLTGVAPVTVVVDIEPEPVTLRVAGGHFTADLGGAADTDLRITAGVDTTFRLLSGGADLDLVEASGEAVVEGSASARAAFADLVGRAAAPRPASD